MKWLKGCAAAFRFLTIIPLPTSFGSKEEDLSRAAFFFPVVGLFLGVVAAGAAWIFWLFVPPLAAAVLLTFLLLAFSGGLHLDGLADTADGFFSARDRTRTLEIMRDSRTGVMGVGAVVLIVLLKVSSLAPLQPADAIRAGLLAPCVGRCAILVMMYLLPYVRRGRGLGTLFYGRGAGWPALFGMIIVLGIGAFLKALVPAVTALTAVLLFSFYCRRKIGGATGDTLGAACEIGEAVAMFTLTVQHWNTA